MKRVLLALAFILLARPAFSACNTSLAPVYSATNATDLQDCFTNQATHSGDSVHISGAGFAVTTALSWTVPPNAILYGDGAGVTTIQENITNANGLMLSLSIAAGQTFRMTAMTIAALKVRGSPADHIINIDGGSTSFRMDHMAFTGFDGSCCGHVVRFDNIFGVIDHNSFSGGFIQYVDMNNSAYQGVGAWGDNSWAQPDGYGSANFLFLEDNTFTNSTQTYQSTTECVGNGCRFVLRYNTFTNYGTGYHGTESSGRQRGGRLFEIYNNDYVARTDTMDTAVIVRSGTGIFWGNTLEGNNGAIPAWNNGLKPIVYRASGSLGGWGTCDGTGPWDDNTGTVYDSGTATANSSTVLTDNTKSWTTNQWFVSGSPYSLVNTTAGTGSQIDSNTATTITWTPVQNPNATGLSGFTIGDGYEIRRAVYCIDQPGRGQSDLLSGDPASPTGDPHNALDPIIVVANTIGAGGIHNLVAPNSAFTIADRDYYEQVSGVQTTSSSPFDGTTGTGWGTFARRPSTCTAGVFYLATDQGSQGGLGYHCTSTNTWTQDYTPYTYPHPLIDGACVPDHLAFVLQPSGAVINAVLGTVRVGVYDSGDALCDTATNTVTIANKGGTCAGMTLGGTKSGAASSGLFDTTDLFENAAGACTLSATASGLTGADSDAFTISAIAVGGGGFGLHGR